MRWAIIPSKWQSQTKKKIAATDAIFEQVNQVNAAADSDPVILRISMLARLFAAGATTLDGECRKCDADLVERTSLELLG